MHKLYSTDFEKICPIFDGVFGDPTLIDRKILTGCEYVSGTYYNSTGYYYDVDAPEELEIICSFVKKQNLSEEKQFLNLYSSSSNVPGYLSVLANGYISFNGTQILNASLNTKYYLKITLTKDSSTFTGYIYSSTDGTTYTQISTITLNVTAIQQFMLTPPTNFEMDMSDLVITRKETSESDPIVIYGTTTAPFLFKIYKDGQTVQQIYRRSTKIYDKESHYVSLYIYDDDKCYVRRTKNYIDWETVELKLPITDSAGITNVSYNNGIYAIALYTRGYNYLLLSSDGVNFVNFRCNGLDIHSRADVITYCLNNKFFATIQGSLDLFVSDDLHTWTKVTISGTPISNGDKQMVYYKNNYFLFDSYSNANAIYKSSDGYNWTKVTTSGLSTTYLDGPVSLNGRVYIKSQSALYYSTSDDLSVWTQCSFTNHTGSYIGNVAYGKYNNTDYYFFADGDYIQISNDGQNFTSELLYHTINYRSFSFFDPINNRLMVTNLWYDQYDNNEYKQVVCYKSLTGTSGYYLFSMGNKTVRNEEVCVDTM